MRQSNLVDLQTKIGALGHYSKKSKKEIWLEMRRKGKIGKKVQSQNVYFFGEGVM